MGRSEPALRRATLRRSPACGRLRSGAARLTPASRRRCISLRIYVLGSDLRAERGRELSGPRRLDSAPRSGGAGQLRPTRAQLIEDGWRDLLPGRRNRRAALAQQHLQGLHLFRGRDPGAAIPDPHHLVPADLYRVLVGQLSNTPRPTLRHGGDDSLPLDEPILNAFSVLLFVLPGHSPRSSLSACRQVRRSKRAAVSPHPQS